MELVFQRVHFTLLWYPDGDYTTQTYLYDSWTPAGMLSQTQVVSPINIEGDMYDDWYISHQQQEE